MTTMRTFTTEQLDEWLLPFEGDDENVKIVSDVETRHCDWYSHHELVFVVLAEETLWRVGYREGLTELQVSQMERDDRWYEKAQVEGMRVLPVQELVWVYVDADDVL